MLFFNNIKNQPFKSSLKKKVDKQSEFSNRDIAQGYLGTLLGGLGTIGGGYAALDYLEKNPDVVKNDLIDDYMGEKNTNIKIASNFNQFLDKYKIQAETSDKPSKFTNAISYLLLSGIGGGILGSQLGKLTASALFDKNKYPKKNLLTHIGGTLKPTSSKTNIAGNLLTMNPQFSFFYPLFYNSAKNYYKNLNQNKLKTFK